METQSLARIPTVFQPPSPDKQLPNGTLEAKDRHRSDVSEILQATQTLPRGTALAREESSIAFSSIFNTKPADEHHKGMQEDGIEDPVQQMTQLLDGFPLSSAPPAEVDQASPILGYTQAIATQGVQNGKVQASVLSDPAPSMQERAQKAHIQAPPALNPGAFARSQNARDITQQLELETNRALQLPSDQCPKVASPSRRLKSGPTAPVSSTESESEGDLDCDCGNNSDSRLTGGLQSGLITGSTHILLNNRGFRKVH